MNFYDENLDIFFDIINRFVGLYSREASRETQNDPDCEYPFVAMDTRQVFSQIAFARNYLEKTRNIFSEGKTTFLDIGCGIGNVLLIAEQFGFDAYGIEKDPYTFRIASQLIGKEKIEQADIWNYERYDHFNVIYYFRPFSDREPQLRFEKLIEESMREEAILIANHKNSDAIDNDKRFLRLHKDLPVWMKKS